MATGTANLCPAVHISGIWNLWLEFMAKKKKNKKVNQPGSNLKKIRTTLVLKLIALTEPTWFKSEAKMDFICIEIDRNEPTWFKFQAKIDFICTEIDRSEPTWFKFDAKMDFICIEIDRSN